MNQKFRSFSKRLTRRIVMALALMLAVIYACIYSISYFFMGGMVENAFYNLLDAESMSVSMVLSDIEVAARNSIDDVEERVESPEGVRDALANELRLNPAIKGFYVAFEADYYPQKGRWFEPYAVWRDGRIDTLQVGSASHDYFKKEWYQKALCAKKHYWSEPYYDEAGAKEKLCSYLRPFFNKSGRRVGVFGADVSLDWLQKKLLEMDVHTNKEKMGLSEEQVKRVGSFSFLIGREGTYISHPDKSRILHGNFFEDVNYTTNTSLGDLAKEMAARKMGFRLAEINHQQVYVFYAPVRNTEWTLGFVVVKSIFRQHAYLYGLSMLMAMAVGLFAVYIISRITIRHSTKPLSFLAKSADEVAMGNFNAPLPEIHHNDEICKLRDSFGHMQQSLALYIEKLKSTTAEKASIESELNIARNIQMSMLSTAFPKRDDIEIYASMTPAKAVGGDLYDFFLRDGRVFFCIGDVSGKGVPAAMLMTVARNLFRAYSNHEDSPQEIITKMNKMMSEDNKSSLFVTFFVGVLDLQSGMLRYCSAGHEPPVVVGSDASMLPFLPALPIGALDDTPYQEMEFMIEPDTTLLLFTDGLTEAKAADDGMFQRSRVMEVACQAIAEGRVLPQSLIEMMTKAVEDFVVGAEQSDDLTMLAIRRKSLLSVTLTASAESYPELTKFIASIGDSAHLDSYEAGRLRLVIEEAVGNIIDYSGATTFGLSVAICDSQLSVTITDDGQPFDPTAIPDPDLDVSGDKRQPGGLGILYMRQMSDGMTYRREGDKNVLVIRKKISS